MPLEIPTPDGLLELFRDEIVPREAAIDGEYEGLARESAGAAWSSPFPGVETLVTPDGTTLMRVTFRRQLDPAAVNETDRVRHELRQLWNDIRASIPPDAQAEFVAPRVTHVDRPGGIEVICYTQGIVRTP